MENTVVIPQELIDQQSCLTSKLSDLAKQEAELAVQKTAIESSLRRIDTAVRFLRGEALPVLKVEGVRRPMSEAGKANIRAALLRNSEAKRAAAKAAAEAPPAPETPSAPGPVAATVNDQPEGTTGPNAAGRLARKQATKK
jgi:hypothetical protein